MPPDPTLESEWLTRKTRIDGALGAADWTIAPALSDGDLSGCDKHALVEFETTNGPADYALAVKSQPLGVVEAKKVTLGRQNVLTQAQRYARGFANSPFQFGEYRVPFLYSTNGEVICFQDVRHPLNRSRRIAKFHTPAALEEMLRRDFDTACQWFGTTPNNHPHLRPYQIEANAAIEQAISERKRQMLVAMATGTGKTFTMVNQVYRVDRRAMSGSTSVNARVGQSSSGAAEVELQSPRQIPGM
jgi:type I restriction enzyme R subunit